MNRRTAILLFVLTWALIYLPHLGSDELRGEEARRILPAREMIETGDWIVPRLAGEVYSAKPPLINWLIASSFLLTGHENEWTARLPNVVALLGFGLFCILFLAPWLGLARSLHIALATITTIALVDKSRMAEIETLLVVLTGSAMFVWMRFWAEDRSPWVTWLAPGAVLAVGALAKGPVNLVFFLLLVVCTLARARNLRSLLHPAVPCTLILSLLPFTAWALANLALTPSADATTTDWWRQVAIRFRFENIDWGDWAQQVLQIPLNFLPWLMPLAYALFLTARGRKRESVSDSSGRLDNVIGGSCLAILTGASFVLLLPQGLPRYTMPLFPPAALVTVLLFSRLPLQHQRPYENFARRTVRVGILLIFVIACIAPVVLIAQEKIIDVEGVILAALLTIGGCVFVFRWGRRVAWQVEASLVIALGVAVTLLTIWPSRTGDPKAVAAARQIETIAEESPHPLVIYAERRFRSSSQLRILFYLDPAIDSIGETGSLPDHAFRLVYRQPAGKQVNEVLAGRQITVPGRLTLSGHAYLMRDVEAIQPEAVTGDG